MPAFLHLKRDQTKQFMHHSLNDIFDLLSVHVWFFRVEFVEEHEHDFG